MKAMNLACIVGLTAALAAGPAMAKPPVHPPQTAPEQALDKILKLDAKKPEAVDPAAVVTRGRPRTTPPPNAGYLKYLTRPVAVAILVEEAKDVQANCHGVYIPDEECGMESDPVICAQDFPSAYLYRTVQTGPGLAVVETAWRTDDGKQGEDSGVYRMKLIGGVWKIDGISCPAGDRYNWTGR